MKIKKKKPRTTMSDIARDLGYTQPTVSIVLNGLAESKRISPETQQRIEAYAAEIGYLPRQKASRKSKRNASNLRLIGFVIPTLMFSYWPEVVAGAEDFLAAQGCRILLAHTGFDTAKEMSDLKQFASSGIEALIISPCSPEETLIPILKEITTRIPVVLVGTQFKEFELDSVTTADLSGGRTATEHLLGLKHRHIGHISGPLSTWAGERRRLGYEDALRAARVNVDAHLIQETDFTIRGGYQGMKAILKQGKPSAVFAASDAQAMGAIFALEDSGLKVPKDCAIVGYDDLSQSRYFHIPLTSMCQPKAEVGALACHRALDMIRQAGRHAEPNKVHHHLSPQLIVRASCGASPRYQQSRLSWADIVNEFEN